MTTILSVGSELSANQTTAGSQFGSSVSTFADGSFIVSWVAGPDDNTRELLFRHFDADLSSVGEVNAGSSDQYGGGAASSLAFSDGTYDLIWYSSQFDGAIRHVGSFYNFHYDLQSPQPAVSQLRDERVVGGNENVSAETMPDGGYVMVGDNQVSRYNANHQLVANRVLSASYDAIYDITSLGGGAYAVAWSKAAASADGEIFLERFNSANVSQGVVQVNTTNVGIQTDPTIALLSSGKYVVGWSSASASDVGYDLRAQIYNASGTRSGTEFKINTTTAADQSALQLQALTNGDFVAVWVSNDQDGSGAGIFGQRYSAAGAAIGAEFQVNGATSGDQYSPSVDALPNGGFIVSWTSPDADGTGIFFREFKTSTATVASKAAEIISGTSGADILNAAPGTFGTGDQIDLGAGTDKLVLTAAGTLDLSRPTSFAHVEQLVGSSGNDIWIVSTARLADVTSYTSGGGTDVFSAVGSFTLHAGLAVTNIRSSDAAGTDNFSYTGNEYSQTITGNDGRNTIHGEGGNDTLIGGGGNDILFGDLGNDVFKVENNGDSARESVGQGVDTVLAASSFILLGGSEIEVLATQNEAGTTAMTLQGNEFSQSITGNAGVNKLIGGDGNDVLAGKGGADALDGGADSDTLDYRTSGAGVNINILSNTASGGDAQGDTIVNFENVYGSNSADTVTGNDGANSLRGYGGNDKISGGAGNDILDGGTGADTLTGGAGNDTYLIDNAGDKAYETSGNGTDIVQSSVSYSLSGQYIESLTLTGTGNINGAGNSLANTITGNAGDNTLTGGAGADKLVGGSGVDTASYVGSTVGVNASLNAPTTNTNDAKGDTYSSVENLVGTVFSDRLVGSIGANVLTGRDGNDTLYGGLGNDKLIGGTGEDSFAFHTTLGPTNIDTIDDFSVQDDRIVLDDDIFTKAGSVGDLSSAAFYSGVTGRPHDSSDRIIYNPNTGSLLYDADGTGSAVTVKFATLDLNLKLTAANFDIIA